VGEGILTSYVSHNGFWYPYPEGILSPIEEVGIEGFEFDPSFNPFDEQTFVFD